MIIAADISIMLTALGYEVTGIAPRREDVLKSIESTRPDLVLIDISLKGTLDGVEAARPFPPFTCCPPSPSAPCKSARSSK
ncbi:MAG: hypothetical protein HY842_03590 [Bacteroidetes bacterium]|nr:hypothetical protein [Bacteroidota bacterium]